MRRKMGILLVLGAALPLAAVSTAWACGVLATLKLDSRVVTPGQTVRATGKNFSATGNEIVIRMGNRSGKILATADPTSRLDETFALPANLSPGWYVLMATQTTTSSTGVVTVKAGTPARTTVRVQGTSASAAAPSPWSSTPNGPAGSAASAGAGGHGLPSTLVAMILSLTLLTGGITLVGRRHRPANRASLSVV